jgi:polyphosphate kinase
MKSPAKKQTAEPLFLNRELSWIEFNFRVLEQARDASIPPLERLKFLAITASNADEFFMVRVGGLTMLQRQGHERPDPAGLTPSEQLTKIAERMRELVTQQHRCLQKEIEPALRKGGIRRLTLAELSAPQLRHVESFFDDHIFPVISPVAVSLEDEFPLLLNLGLTLYVRLEPEEGSTESRHAIIAVPRNLARFLTLPSDSGYSYILLEEVIRAYAGRLFPGVAVTECAAFRITRNADMSVREDQAGDLLEQMREVLTERQTSDCVRLEIEKRASREARAFLQKALQVATAGIYSIAGPLDLAAFFRLAGLAGFEPLKNTPWHPQAVPEVSPLESMFDVIKRGNLLLLHPYESYDPMLRLLQEAADDPNVLAIKQVLYRVSDNSAVIAALTRAAERGKHVTALVELKARFDEARNIDWAETLARAGAQVIYGVKGFKTHAKICLIVRREPDGVVRYMHFGTGNYNEKTARLYSDISFFTMAEDYGADASAFFNTLTGYSQMVKYRAIHAAPQGIRPHLLEWIENEAERSRQGEAAAIDVKLNSLTDPELITALYQASQAGVTIRLNVRGICALRPGVKGLSENIQVTSIVDRFLEHARIIRFHNGGDPQLFISSADWMPRNLDRRIELLVPIADRPSREKLNRMLETYFADTRQAWRLLPDGSHERLQPDAHHPAGAQEFFQRQAEARAASARQHMSTFEPQRPAERNP